MIEKALLEGCTDGQADAIRRRSEPGFIMAGAGTGKTFTLSRRMASQMGDDEPLSPERSMAITFTDAAAAELLDRTRRTVADNGIDGADKMEAAWISTIHSMCRRMLSENAIDADLDPGLVLMTETQAAEAMARAIDGAVASADPEKAARLVSLLDGSYSRFSSLVGSVVSIASRAPGGVAAVDFGPYAVPAERAAANALHDIAREAVAVYEQAAGAKKGKTKDTLLDDLDSVLRIEQLSSDNQALSDAADNGELDEIGLKSRVGDVKEEKESVKAAMGAYAAAHAIDKDRDLIPFVREVAIAAEADLSRMIRDMNKMTFDSLLKMCHDMLEDDALAKAYSQSFDSVMVDEFQDTDPLQTSIIKKLCSDERGLSKLTCVGDRQQSIYGFRGADVSVSDDMQSDMEREFSDATIPLDTNFRSHPDILSYVGSVFSDDRFFGNGFLDLKPGDGNAKFALPQDMKEGSPAIELHITKTETRGTQCQNSVRAEADFIAARFKELKAGDPDTSYDDMALLLRSFTNVDAYLDAFKAAGVPAAITGGRRFYMFPEVMAAMSFLRFASAPHDDLLLFQLISGDMFRLSDDDLISLKGTYNKAREAAADGQPTSLWEVLSNHHGELPDAVDDAWHVLSSALSSLVTAPLSKVFMEAARSSGWIDTIYLDELTYPGKIANIIKAADMISDLESQYGLDYMSVIDEMVYAADAAESFGGKDNATLPGRTVGKGQPGCVSIMTIHASKGLEFPIVVLDRAESTSKGLGRVLAATVKDGGARSMKVALNLWDIQPADSMSATDDELDSAITESGSYGDYIAAMGAKLSAAEEAEARRLLYVGLTRAKSKLIWIAGIKEKKDGSAAALEKIFQEAFDAAFDEDVMDATPGVHVSKHGTRVLFGQIEVPPEPQDYPESASFERAASRKFALPEYGYSMSEDDREPEAMSFTSALQGKPLTDEAKTLLDADAYDGLSAYDAGRSHGNAEEAMLFGDVFHACARKMMLCGDMPSPASIRRTEIEFDSDGMSDDISSLLAELQSSAVWTEMTSAEWYAPEVPMKTNVAGLDIEGKLDVMAVTGGHAVIYDYKTGQGGKSAADIIGAYGYQALMYAAGVLADDSVDDVQVVFVLVDHGMDMVKTPTWSIDDLDEITSVIKQAAFAPEN